MNKRKEIENINVLYNALENCEDKISDKFEELNELLIKQYSLNRNIKEKINIIEQEFEKDLDNEKDGITIDYKTFSDIINILSFAIPYNLCDKDFVDNLIKLGMKHEAEKEKNLVKNKETNDNNQLQGSNTVELNEEEIANILSQIFFKKLLKNN